MALSGCGAVAEVKRPSGLPFPAFLMNFPFTVDNREFNNPLMGENPEGNEGYDHSRANRQWLKLYRELARDAVVYLLPHENSNLQDLPFVANIGAFLPHTGNVVLMANFSSEPRKGEEEIGSPFLHGLGYQTKAVGHYWEGEADLKFIKDNIYVGGYGIRSQFEAYEEMVKAYDMEIVPVFMSDERLYHLDCQFFPLSAEKALVAVSVLDDLDIKQMEKHFEIIEVPKQFVYDGWTNSICLNDKVLIGMPAMDKGRDAFEIKESRNALEDVLVANGYEPVMVDLGEFDKSGADLSCLCLHLNFNGRN